MAYITRKKIKGITYYYAEERERRDGKSRRKWQKYLGPLHKIIEAMEGTPEKPKYAEIFQLEHINRTYNVIGCHLLHS